MSTREAAIKLTLDGAQFSVSIKKIGDAVDATAAKGKKSMSSFAAGITAARRGMNDLGGAAKRTLGMAASLGGAFSVGTAIKGAVELQSTYSGLAFGIQTATGQMVKSSEVQKLVEQSAAKTTRTSEEMAAAFGAIFQATGDLDFSRDVLDSIGTAATATGEEVSTLGTVADQLHTKFGVAASGMQGAFAKVFELSKKGGPKFSEFADVMSNVGAELLAAGLDGERGLNFMLGALVQTDDKMKSLPAQVKGLKAVLRGLGNESELKGIAKSLAIDPKVFLNEPDAIARVRKILSMGSKGVAALEGSMKEGEEKQALKILFTDPFEKALLEAQASGLKGQAAVDKALLVLDGQLGQFGKASLGAAGLQEEANRRAEEPQAKLRQALNNLNTAFSQPEILGAINDLAKHLPALATIFGRFVTFAAKNPLLSATLGLGGKIGTDFLGGAARSILDAHLKGASATQAGIAAGGSKLGSVLGVAGKAFGIAAAAALAYKVGTEAIDNGFKEEDDAMERVRKATSASAPKNAKERDAQIAELEASMKGTEDVGGGFFNGAARFGAGAADWITGGTGDDVPDARKPAAEARARAQARIDELSGTRFGATTVDSPAAVAAAGAGKATAVQLDRAAPGMIASALQTGLSGTVLTVRLANPGEIGLGRASPGPGGSRGPKSLPPAAPGGGV
jgi:hypothetical protein